MLRPLPALLVVLGSSFGLRAAEAPVAPPAAPPAASWPFEPPRDTFSPEALFDLRELNEKVAGDHGFIRTTPEGGFALGNGNPVRFWAVNFSGQDHLDDAELAHAARFLAKRGVNMVRWHGFINPGKLRPKEPATSVGPLEQLDLAEREKCWRLVAAMRREGIYLTLSPYWATHFKGVDRFGYEFAEGRNNAEALLFFEPRLQAAYRQWLRDWLTAVNPHTGLALKDDPAVALIQFQNEDSLLFPTIDRIHPRYRRLLGEKFSAWLSARPGGIEAARATWGPSATIAGDDWPTAPALLPVWHYQKDDIAPGLRLRLASQLEFVTTTMAEFNAGIARYLRDELGVKCPLNAGNWRTGDSAHLNDAERWSYLPAEVLGTNRYFSAIHLGARNGWAMQLGDRFVNRSLLTSPREFPGSLRQVEGRPMIIPESAWVMPNLYRAEGPLTTAAYLSLSGVDVFYWFNGYQPEWTQPKYRKDIKLLGADFKWTFQTPDTLGQFPAAALLFRRSDLSEGSPVLQETRPLSELWAFRQPLINEDPGFDANRDLGDRAVLSGESRLPPFAYLIGPVKSRFTATGPSGAEIADLKPWLDTEAGTVRANTRQIVLDYRRGILKVDAPRTQGFVGFLAAAPAPLSTADLEVACTSPYASILAVSLDDAPLASSTRVLLQLGTTNRPTGWQSQAAQFKDQKSGKLQDGEEVVRLGDAPWQVSRLDATLALRNTVLKRATVTDANGLAVSEIALLREGAVVRLTLPHDALYVVLR